MSTRKCPHCGEQYSVTYRNCPFCEEEAALAAGRPIRRRKGRRTARPEPSIMGPVMLLALLLLIGVLVFFFYGDKIATRFFPSDNTVQPSAPSSQEEIITPPSFSEEALLNPDVPPVASDPETVDPDAPVIPDPETAPPSVPEVSDPSTLPQTLKLSSADFTMSVGEAPIVLTVSGGGTYQWYSDNTAVATVDQQGRVTAVAPGNTNVYAHNGTAAGSCIVRVKGGSSAPSGSGDSGANARLSSEDFTLHIGESHRLTVSGTSAAVTWSSNNPSVASISSNGTVTAVSRGTTNVIATVGNKTLQCIVRIVP